MILITGATGKVGRALVEKLLKSKKYQGKIRILTRDPLKARAIFGKKAQIAQGELGEQHDFIAIAHACKGIDTIVHCAALLDYSAPEREMMQTNYGGTAQLLRAARLHGARPRFIYISSSSLYRGSGTDINENTAPNPLNAYGKSKLMAEKAVKSGGLPYVILRPPIVYGKGNKTGFALVVQMIKKGRMFVIGDGNNHIPHIHISDLVRAIELAIGIRKINEEFLLSSGELVTQMGAYKEIASILKVRPPSIHVPKSVAYMAAGLARPLYSLFGKKPKIYKEYVHTLAENRIFNIQKARRVLRFSPRVKFREGIRDLIAGLD
ncbi:MAG: NAD-dependent epimerase/dehydratase family protein [Candidatus Micrarchaeota archaeon]